jgi:tripartite-type tricarboxylate transporter receptor subunit TctC
MTSYSAPKVRKNAMHNAMRARTGPSISAVVLRARNAWLGVFLLAAILCSWSAAHAQSSSTRAPIRLIIPFAAGSYTDTVARIISPGLSERLGRAIVVDNRPGANGIIGADLAAKATPDGSTLLVGGASVNVVNPGLYKSLPYDPEKDLVAVARIGILPFMLLTNPSVPAANLPELIAYAKKNPGKLAYATPNSITLVGMETLKRNAGVDILSVPYKSSPQAVADLIGGQVQVLIADFATAMPQVRAGKIRLLAVTMSKRSALLPDVPAIDEVVKGFDISAFTALFGPKGMSHEVASRNYEALRAVLTTKDTQDKLASIGFDIAPMGPDAFAPYIHQQIGVWGKLIRAAGVTPE